MNHERIREIVQETTAIASPEVVASIRSDVRVEVIDLVLVKAYVDVVVAAKHKDELVALLDAYDDVPGLREGPSYIHVGAALGDQGIALGLFGLGHALKLWRVVTPMTIGFYGAEARDLAGSGMVMISGYGVPVTGETPA